ncbi:hypothetical protein GUJ93_ZPchr0004g39270 [Zizania palustris]|uniref:Uncharacterized protein n=1 Tax=Zizania palustris TaxID=103762 RepID=A0A8J5T0L0_ZIZPA|nr:hypothetical protein GUJ93_ZPchr0004g39270 [Zizania palustris]
MLRPNKATSAWFGPIEPGCHVNRAAPRAPACALAEPAPRHAPTVSPRLSRALATSPPAPLPAPKPASGPTPLPPRLPTSVALRRLALNAAGAQGRARRGE